MSTNTGNLCHLISLIEMNTSNHFKAKISPLYFELAPFEVINAILLTEPRARIMLSLLDLQLIRQQSEPLAIGG